jgi:hypothetical protein
MKKTVPQLLHDLKHAQEVLDKTKGPPMKHLTVRDLIDALERVDGDYVLHHLTESLASVTITPAEFRVDDHDKRVIVTNNQEYKASDWWTLRAPKYEIGKGATDSFTLVRERSTGRIVGQFFNTGGKSAIELAEQYILTTLEDI